MDDGPININAGDTDDGALIKRLQAGDLCAFDVLFHTYKKRVFSLSCRLLSSAQEAEDLTQEVFLRVFRKINSFRGQAAFSTWLHRLAVNTVIEHLRKKRNLESDTPREEMPDSPIAVTKAMTEVCLDRIRLEAALAALPQGYRTSIVLHDIEGYEHQEIARLLGCSIGTSKSQLHKARIKLRVLLRR